MKIKIDLDVLLSNLTSSEHMSTGLQEQIAMGIEHEVDKMARQVSRAADLGLIKFRIDLRDASGKY